MAQQGPLFLDGSQTVAGADLSNIANQYLAVKLTAARTIGLATTGGEAICGILHNNPRQGDAAQYAFGGLSPARIGAAGCAAGDKLMTEAATGKLVTATGGNTVVAVAYDAGAANDVITVRIVPSAG